MNVTLPNGRIINNVPAGTSKDAIRAKAISAGLATEEDFGGDTSSSLDSVADDVSTKREQDLPLEQQDPSLGQSILGGLEAVGTVASGILAEPVAGIAGMGAGLVNQGAEILGQDAPLPSAGDTVGIVRDGASYQPRTETGQEYLQNVGEAIEPVAEVVSGAENYLGDTAYNITGSPAIAAAAKTMPTAIMELIGVAGGKGALRAGRRAKNAKQSNRIMQEIDKSAPSVDQLFDTASDVYKEIDDMGASVDQRAYRNMANRIRRDAKKGGVDPIITPKAQQALRRIDELADGNVAVSDIDMARKIAKNAAGSIEKTDAALGMQMIDTIDDFMDNLTPAAFTKSAANPAELGSRYKIARNLWGRGRRSELLGEAFEKARNQASGFENGLRTQFRQLLNNKRTRKMFNADEIDAMKKVVQGSKGENLARQIGRLSPADGVTGNALNAMVGSGAGYAVGGPVGAVAIPGIGYLSRKLAQRMTVKNAEFADQVIRAGKDAKKITKAYLDNTAKEAIDSAELSQLLMRPDIDLTGLPQSPLIQRAAQKALKQREDIAAAAGAGVAGREQQAQ